MENIVLKKINYVNGKDKGPAIRAENLNQTQQYTQNAFDKITPIITDIENNTTENTTDLIATKQFIENSMKTLSAEGTSIHVEDSADYPCTLKVEGKSEQVQTEQGKNLLDLEELNSSTETWIVSAKKLTLTLKPNTQYTCSSNVPAPVDASIDAAIDKPLYFNGSSWNGGAGVCIGQSKTKTTDENGNLYIAIALNRTYSEELLNGTYYIQIEEGATATEYEPFIPNSPSPEYPSKIENVSGDLEKYTYNNGTYGFFKISGQGRDLMISIKDKNTNIDVKNCNIGFTGNGINSNEKYKWIIGNGTVNYNGKTNNILTSSEKMMYVSFYPNNQETLEKLFARFNIQVEEGTVATDYEPYKEQSVTFPLGEQKLMEDGYLGENGVVNKRKQVVLDGMESWNKSAGKNNSFYFVISERAMTGLCSHYKRFTSSSQIDIKDGIYLSNTVNIIITDLRFTDVTEFKNWLAEQYANGTPVIIEYEVEKEETTAYTTEQQTAYNALQKLKTYRTTTNISNSQDTNMVLTYKKDLQTQFQEIETMLLESGV